MSFFGKLRDRLFKSSKKLEEGLDAIVDDGGAIEEAETATNDDAERAAAEARAAEEAQAARDAEAAAEQARQDALEQERLAAE